MEKVEIVGVNICNITLNEGKELVREYLQRDRLHMIFTPNSEILMVAVKDPEFTKILNEADLVIPDGIGVVIASKFYHQPLRERVAGFDLTCKMMELADERHIGVYFFGAKPGVAAKAQKHLLEKHPGIVFQGARDGYFTEEDEEEIIADINASGAEILCVGLGAPKQEKWIYRNRERLNVKVAIGIGGSIDVFAGEVQRAPEFWQKHGLEWFYRLVKQPSRFFRMLALPRFILTAKYDAIFKRP